MPGSKPGALPLGDAPSLIATGLLPGAMNAVAAKPRHAFRIGAKRLCDGTSLYRNVAYSCSCAIATGMLPGHALPQQPSTRGRDADSRTEKPPIVAAGAIRVNSGGWEATPRMEAIHPRIKSGAGSERGPEGRRGERPWMAALWGTKEVEGRFDSARSAHIACPERVEGLDANGIVYCGAAALHCSISTRTV